MDTDVYFCSSSEKDSDYDVELSSSSDEAEDDDDPDRAIANARQCSKIYMNSDPPGPPRLSFLGSPVKTFSVQIITGVLEYLEAFLDDLVLLIDRETNRYAEQKLNASQLSEHSRLKKWVPTTTEEIRDLTEAYDLGTPLRPQLMSDRSAEGSFRVLFIDYGNSEVVPLGSLRPLPPRFAEQPLFAMCVVPQGVSPLDPRLERLLSEQPFAAVQVGSQKGVPVVRLVRRDGTCINDMLTGQDPQTPPKEAAPAKQAPATPPASAPTSALASALAAKVLPKAAVVHNIAECPKPQGRFEALVSTVDSNTVYVSQALASEGERPATALTKLPSPSQCVLALYSADKLWYRARVLSADHNARQVQVRFVDFGNVETVSGKDVRPLREELAREPACVLPVVLAGVARLAPNAVDLLPAEVLTVEPTDNASPPSVRLMHAGTCINDRVASQPEPPKKTLVDNPLPSGRVAATVAHIALPDGLFYLQQTSLASALLAMMEELNASAATAPKPASLKLGDAVCARYAVDGLWYRGAVVEPAKDAVGPLKILFVDFGNSEDVPKADLKALPEKFETVPLFANCVVLDAVASVSQECAQQLVSAEVEVEVADASCQPPKVRLYVNGSCINELVD
ncbi:hypothetical protein HPB47_009890 [Ixodes persulcatus]|uniref:Uncharacterized protein n=1 Tax=Ixodes persulcatus TaxID=34615 RepID=A0AC60P0J3_IXOPE|nr:hypothetical protein HPB47_009890 [Ixodes persulcatus]